MSAPERLKWTPELVERFWNGVAGTRLNDLSFSRLGGKAFVTAIEHLLPRHGTILDFGAGDGDLVGYLLEKGFRVAAFEPAGARRAALERRYEGQPGFLGVVGETERRRFDVVLLVEVIEHILDEQLQAALERVTGLVRAGGLLIVSTPNNEDLELSMAYCPASNVLFHRWQHVRSMTPDSLAAMLLPFGVKERVTHLMEYQNHLFLPYDPLWGGANPPVELPEFLASLRNNVPTRFGNESHILFVGERL
ncbi:MAG: hypothetical protein A3H97_03595 [Acidobacteria bacterium RIFCSPLOWO2_02_FULL_65_29]|nr:MAG: hypothetical protein A3H97_03595 [Acidobacteria bacterium RIFCSPLOWO2_02_FULL_65_29]